MLSAIADKLGVSLDLLMKVDLSAMGESEILIAKSLMDLISSIVFSAALGVGVLLSAVSVLVIQGGLVLLSGFAEPLLTTQVVTEMSAVGGTLFIGMAVNLMGISEKKIKIGDMLPAIFLPILYFPVAAWLGGLF